MRIEQLLWTESNGWSAASAPAHGAQLVFVFGSPARVADAALIAEVRTRYPNAYLFGCSTAGEIHASAVTDESLSITACQFDHTILRTARVQLGDFESSRAAGRALGRALNCEGLSHVLVLSDGVRVNGSELTKGISEHLPSSVGISGGLSGDGDRFQRTLVCDGNTVASGSIAAIGLIGNRLIVGYGSGGGWSPFGPQRTITRSNANILYELDGEPALHIYKKYLGEYANKLPSSALLFPLSIWPVEGGEPTVRTVLSVDESGGSLTFAGDVPEGYCARLMKTNTDALIQGASDAARDCRQAGGNSTQLALLISCIGRKLILRNRVDEEVEAVANELNSAKLTGFYSYGEICPVNGKAYPTFLNQTMTITTFAEA